MQQRKQKQHKQTMAEREQKRNSRFDEQTRSAPSHDDDDDEDDDDDDDREAVQNGMGAQQLAGIRARLAEFDAAEAWLHDDDDDDDGDNYLYESPLDDEDPNQHFVRALHACKRAGDFEALCAQLGAERLATLQQVAVEVEQQASQALV